MPDEPVEAPGGGAPSDSAVERWLPAVYEELRRIARSQRIRIAGGETLATTALINEAYLRLADSPEFESHAVFLRIAAVAMRRILIDRIRQQRAAKRGGGATHVDLDAIEDFIVRDEDHVMGVHDALERLQEVNPRLVDIVECRFFAGFNDAQTAEALGLSTRSVQRGWATARAWLKKELAQ